MAFRLGCTRAKSGIPNTYEKAVSQKPIAEKAITLFKAISRWEEYCHELAIIEKVWPRALTV
eukprot:715030-Pelagomonas_calceolata.AAC.1